MTNRSISSLVGTVAAAVLIAGVMGQAQTPPAAPVAAQAPAGGAGRGGAPAPDCGGRTQIACPDDVTRMVASLPATAPAKPKQPRRVLVLGMTGAGGFVHSSIPLAARTIEEMGKKTGAWTSDISYDASTVTPENLKQYDAIFLSSTTGPFLDVPGDQATSDVRRAAFLDFIRNGKGLAGIHAASDSYHGNPNSNRGGGAGGRRGGGAPGVPSGAPGAGPAVTGAGAPPAGAPPAGRATGGGRPLTLPCTAPGRGDGGGDPMWPDFNKIIGGYFKWHWSYPTPITVKIDDPKSPINAAFKGHSFTTMDEVYTFNQDSFSRENVHVLTSLDYSSMTACDRALEGSPRTDADYGLSWIRREGKGRMFYEALGHQEAIYYNNPAMLEHILAGMQYALGDLAADDSPSVSPKKK